MKLSELGEAAVIERIAALFGAPSSPGVVGIGDDCAVLPLSESESLLLTTDHLTAGVHFLFGDIPPQDLGWKSLAVNLSDIAAMGGTPLFALLTLALPKTVDTAWLDGFLEGFHELCAAHAVSLIGGDTTAAENDAAVSVTVVGKAETSAIKRRSAALPGDLLCVTGTLGDSRAGLLVILRRLARSGAAGTAVRRHYRPDPAVHEGMFLGGNSGVHAMMDLSDGLRADLARLCAASRCGAAVQVDELPLSVEVQAMAAPLGFEAADIAVTGGEDYRLLFTVAPGAQPALFAEYAKRFGAPPACIGKITAADGRVEYLRHGRTFVSKDAGFEHFGKP